MAVIASIHTWWQRWRNIPGPAGDPERVPVTPSAHAQNLVGQWLSGEADHIQALGLETLQGLADASPQSWDNESPAAAANVWIDTVLQNHLATAISHNLSTQNRYLILVQVLCQGLAQEYANALCQGQRLRCPLIESNGMTPRSRPWLRPDQATTFDPATLALWLACARLPEAGRLLLGDALARGWPGFSGNASATFIPPARKHPKASMTIPARSAHGVKTVNVRRSTTAEAHSSPSGGERELLRQAVTAALLQLTQSAAFNRHGGEGWRVNEVFFLCAKPFAERLQDSSWVATQAALQKRKTLYRRLAHWGLIETNGSMPIWKIRITEPGCPQPQFASVIKLPAALYRQAVSVKQYHAGTVQKVVE